MKKLWNRVFISVLILMPLFFTSCQSSDVEENGKYNLAGEKFVELNEETDFLSTKISYPQFKDYPELSKKIKNTVEADWKEFRKVAEKEWTEISSVNNSSYPPFEYYVSSRVSYSENIVSIYLETYRFSGGAHGETFIKTINYDKKSGKYLNIGDVTGLSYEELSDICRKDLYTKLISNKKLDIEGDEAMILSDMINEGTLPVAGNFENFTVSGDYFTVYFDQYKVAPGYYGILETDYNLK